MAHSTPHYLIGGKFDTASDLPPLDAINPCTEEVLWQSPTCGPDHVAQAIAHAKAAAPVWAAVHGWERAAILRKVADQFTARADEIARVMALEIGRPVAQSKVEVMVGRDNILWAAGEAERLFGQVLPSRIGGKFTVTPEPVGIVAAFTAWNFPINLPLRKMGPALAAGCPVILRPAEQTPMTATLIGECFHEGGVPAGVVQVLLGEPNGISPHLMASEDIRKITFTGSTAVGKMLLKQAADTVKRTSMELGGHSALVVCADADVKLAAEQAALFKFRNSGQVCIAPNRFYVHDDVAEEFTDRLVAEAEALVLGDSMDPASTMGPMIHAAQRDKVERLIAQAIESGAELRTGGKRPEDRNAGYFLAPTVLDNVPDQADIMIEEPFGPVAAVARFSALDDAIARANGTPFGLAAYGFTSDQGTAERLSRELHAGMVGINTGLVASPEVPFGGFDHSGIGKESGTSAIHDYLNLKTTHFMF